MYSHKLVRINYTTYDVRREQDMVNASTSHCQIMVLADSDNDSDSTERHPYHYGKVLGAYHVNVHVRAGSGDLVDCTPARMEFLWVRWYRLVDVNRGGWAARRLDRVRFMPINSPDAFGFVDPADILRSCHIVPVFARGRLYANGLKGISLSAGDSNDWAEYYVNR